MEIANDERHETKLERHRQIGQEHIRGQTPRSAHEFTRSAAYSKQQGGVQVHAAVSLGGGQAQEMLGGRERRGESVVAYQRVRRVLCGAREKRSHY